MSSIVAHQITGPVCEHGEGPAWSPRWAGLRFVDMLRGELLELTDEGVARRHVGDEVAAVVRARRTGGWLVVTQHGVRLADGDALDAPLRPGPVLWAEEAVRANEGACDPAGALYVGSMAWDATPGRGSLRRLAADGSAQTVLEGITISNGLGWTADGTHAYYVDTVTGTIDTFDWRPEVGLTGRRPWAVVPDGGADGLAVDQDGGVWVAIYGGSAVHHYSATGDLIDVVKLPVRQPTALAFAGPNLDRLIVTTSRYALSDPEPAAGALFEFTGHGVRGVPLGEFAG